MGTAILRGISASLLVTVLTLMGGMLWTAMGFGGISVSGLVDIGLLLSCLIGGYRTGKESGVWILGGVTGAGYVAVGSLLLALFLPLRSIGVFQVMLEGGLAGLIAGAIGARGTGRMRGMGRIASFGRPQTSYAMSTDYAEEDWGVTEDHETDELDRGSVLGAKSGEHEIVTRQNRARDDRVDRVDRDSKNNRVKNDWDNIDNDLGMDMDNRNNRDRADRGYSEGKDNSKSDLMEWNSEYNLNHRPWWEEELIRRQ